MTLSGTRRVVVTGVGLETPIGESLQSVSSALQEDQHGVVHMDEWAEVGEMITRLGAPSRELERK